MSVSGLCQICEVREARFTCDNCGAVVCEEHYDRENGFCADCVRLLRTDEDGRLEDVDGSDDVAGGQSGSASD